MKSKLTHIGLFIAATTLAMWPNAGSAQTIAQAEPPSTGICGSNPEACFENVTWQQVPNSYSTLTGNFDYVGRNTLVRNGNAVNFDYWAGDQYFRYAGNCQTERIASIRASDTLPTPNQFFNPTGSLGWALDFACLQTRSTATISEQTRLALTSFGPIFVGMSVPAAEAAGNVALEQIPSGGEPYCLFYQVSGLPGVSFMVIEGAIVRIDIRNPDVASLSGAQIGDSEQRIYELYPGQIESSQHPYRPEGHYLTFVPQDAADQNYRVIFETDGEQVVNFRAGQLPDVGAIEGCV